MRVTQVQIIARCSHTCHSSNEVAPCGVCRAFQRQHVLKGQTITYKLPIQDPIPAEIDNAAALCWYIEVQGELYPHAQTQNPACVQRPELLAVSQQVHGMLVRP